MLNELLIIERGARQAGIRMSQRHPDIKDAGKKPTLRIRLDINGRVVGLDPVPRDVSLWTFGKGNKKRFPFMQPNAALFRLPPQANAKEALLELSKLRGQDRRARLLELCRIATFNEVDLADWPGVRDKHGGWSQEPGEYLEALRTRKKPLEGLRGTDGESVLATVERFLTACDRAPDHGAQLLRSIGSQLVQRLKQSSGDDWLRVAEPLLFRGGGAIFADVPIDEFGRSASDPCQALLVGEALRGPSDADGIDGTCSLTGRVARLVRDTFPDPVTPIGRTILFSRFDAIPSNGRYRRFGARSFQVAQDTAERLAGALRVLTAKNNRDVTWCMIPAEATRKPEKRDLLLAFVESERDLPAAALLAGSSADEELSEEAPDGKREASSVAGFEKRAERLVDAMRAKVGADFRTTPVRLAVLRQVDRANQKIVYAQTLTVDALYHAALDWAAGERNVPRWVTLPVTRRGEQKPRPMSPQHMAPLGVIAFSKQLFIRDGTERQQIPGLTSSEAMALFLDSSDSIAGRRRVERIVKMVLRRRGLLLLKTAHDMRRTQVQNKSAEKRKKANLDFDAGREVLRAVTLLGVLLHKLGRTGTKGDYMSDAAFRLGQLLAAADMVHAGYCADVRGGKVPSSLIGNQVFSMAQTAPAKALSVLGRRWTPYAGWVNRAAREWERSEQLLGSKEETERRRGWDVKKAVRHAREMRRLASDLAPRLDQVPVDDAFRAELLLGYLAGIPATDRGIDGVYAEKVQTTAQGE